MSKQELRAYLKERRAAILPEEKARLDRSLVEQISAMSVFRNAGTVLLYAPHGSEPDLIPLVRVARGLGLRVAFPRCDLQTNTMQFFVLEPTARLIRGAYGIFEPPADAPLCETDEKTLCILPGLSFAPDGSRLGYGKGYYDRFLADFRGVTLGAVYSALVAKSLPTEPHDIPAQLLVTERGVMHCGGGQSSNGASAASQSQAAFRSFLEQCLRPLRRAFSRQRVKEGTAKAYALHAPAILVASIFVLLVISRLLEPLLATRSNEYVAAILMQLIVFGAPTAVYFKLRGRALKGRLRLRVPPPRQLWFTFCMLIIMIMGGLLCGILTGGVSSLTGNFTLYSTFIARMGGSAWQTACAIIAYGVLPAVCEETVFRAILSAEYERFGSGVAIAAGSFYFALLHFSLPLLLSYLFLGVILACALYATRSVLVAVALHLCYNLFCLLGQPYLSAFYVNAGSNEIFVFCLLVMFLLFAAFAAGEGRKIYHRYAKAGLETGYARVLSPKTIPRHLLRALLSPATAVCVGIWLTMAIVDLL